MNSSIALSKAGQLFTNSFNFSMSQNGTPIVNHSTSYNLKNRIFVFGTANLLTPRFYVSTSGVITPKVNWSLRAHANFYHMSMTNTLQYSYSERLNFRFKHKCIDLNKFSEARRGC